MAVPNPMLVGSGTDDPLVVYANTVPNGWTNPLAPAPSHTLTNYIKTPVAADGDGYAEPYSASANVAGLRPGFADKAQDLQQDAGDLGVPTTLISGYRDNALQAKLYSNYQARQAGRAIPYPEVGAGGLAAAPGSSYHNSGQAADIVANNPGGQATLNSLAAEPWRGITPGATFGDPDHYQSAGPRAGVSPGVANSSGAKTEAKATDDSQTPASPAPPGLNTKGLYQLAMLQALAPGHKFTPVDYDPFKVMPHQPGVGN